MAKPKRPRDMNELAKIVGDIATGQAKDDPSAPTAAATRASKGGAGRAKKLTRKKRVAIARNAAKKRWTDR